MKKLAFLFIATAMSFLQICAQNWIQWGSDIHTEGDDNCEIKVDLNNAGDIIIIGSSGYDYAGQNSGFAKVFKNINGNWFQLGQDLTGESVGDHFGCSVSINSEGNIIAVGAPKSDVGGKDAGQVKIFEFISGKWFQIGKIIGGEAAGDHFGCSAGLNAEGNIIAIGVPQSDMNGQDVGCIKIYENISNEWVQIGGNITGISEYDFFGCSVSINSAGDIVAVGAYNNSSNGERSGHVRIFKQVSGKWVQFGNAITGESEFDHSGSALSLNSNGNIVAIGSSYSCGRGDFSGGVRVFRNNSLLWKKVGDNIDGEAAFDHAGYTVSLNSEGTVLAVGSPYYDGTGKDSGHVRIFKHNDNSEWVLLGNEIIGEAAYNCFGYSISLSDDGTVVAISSVHNYKDNIKSGHVRIFKKPDGL